MKNRFIYPVVLLFLLLCYLTGCKTDVKTNASLNMTIDAKALYNEVSAREAVDDTITLTISLYVDNKIFKTLSESITKQSSEKEFVFENIPVGSLIKAEGSLEIDNKTYTAVSKTVTMMETGTVLELEFDWSGNSSGSGDNGNSSQEGQGGQEGNESGNGEGGNTSQEENQNQGENQTGDDTTGEKTVTNSFEVTTPDNSKIKIIITLPQNIYLNYGQISLDAKKLNADGTESDEAVPVTGAQLYYGGNAVPASSYVYNDGVLNIGNSEKLLTPGKYQLYVTAGQSEQNSAASCMADLEVQNLEYYEYSLDGVGTNNINEFGSQIEEDMCRLNADALVVITGNPEIEEGDTYATGVIAEIASSIQNTANHFIDLDMSATGPNLSTFGGTPNDKFDRNDYLRSITLSPNVTSIKAESFEGLDELEVIRFAGTNDDLEIEAGTFKKLSALESFEITGESKYVHTAADGTMLLTAGTPELINGQEVIGRSKIFAVTSKFTNLDLSDEERFPDATNPNSSNYIVEIASYAFYDPAFYDEDKKKLVVSNLGAIDDADDIEEYAFENASITGIKLGFIPNANSFKETSIANLTIDFDVTTENVSDFKTFVKDINNIDVLVFNKDAYLADSQNIFNTHIRSIRSLTFNGHTTIGSGQFKCMYLNTLVFLGPTEIGDNVFTYTYEYEEVDYDGIETLNLSGITKLGENAITIAPLNINQGVFTYPPSIQEMHSNSFVMSDTVRNSITSFSLDQDNTNYGVILDGKGLIDKASKTLFVLANKNLTEVNFTNSGVENIPSDTLANFAGCSNLEDVNLSGVKTIADGAFARCPALNSITIPASLESISALAFVTEEYESGYSGADDTKITSIACDSGNTKYQVIGNFLVEGLGDNPKTLIFSARLTDSTLDFNTYSNSNITSIAPYACSYQAALTSADFSGIVDIQDNAFYECRNLLDLTFGTTLTTIGENAFKWEATESPVSGKSFIFGTNIKLVCRAFGDRRGTVDNITINTSTQLIALKQGAFAGCDVTVPDLSGYDNRTASLTVPSTSAGTWYYINGENNNQAERLATVKGWIENPSSFPGVISNNESYPGMTITKLTEMNGQDGIIHKLTFVDSYGWLYYVAN